MAAVSVYRTSQASNCARDLLLHLRPRRTEVAPERPDPAELDQLALNTPPKLSNSGLNDRG